MYTGDGSLGAGKQFNDFEKHYRPGNRLGRAGILQVMHHGAEGNWHSGLASLLMPEASVFCSDPNHKGYGHPHAAVLRDFWSFHPVQVDDLVGLHLLAVF
jgi:beta-lactamase superfamily II metal-dependent hydrolase